MYNQCPACATLFRVEEELPEEGDLRVRCGMCAHIFDPRLRFTDKLPRRFLPLVPVSESERFRSEESGVVGYARSAITEVMERVQAVSPLSTPSPTSRLGQALERQAELAADAAEADPFVMPRDNAVSVPDDDWHLASMMEIERRRKPVNDVSFEGVWRWVSGILLLLVVFVSQLMWFHRDYLAAYPQLRPFLDVVCNLGVCELPLQQNREQLRLLRAQVTDHPDSPGDLLASGALQNNASFRQPYPLLKLSLLDDNQNVVGERWFHPSDYLEDDSQRQQWRLGMPPQQPVTVRFGVRDPGSGSAQYIFEYR